MPKLKVLYLGISPKDEPRIRVDEEAERIEQALDSAKYRRSVNFLHRGAVSTTRVIEILTRSNPDVLHISAHGDESGCVMLEDDQGFAKSVPIRTLVEVVGLAAPNVRCVVLNACYSKDLAKAFLAVAPTAIGFTAALNDPAAIAFSRQFYGQLGNGSTISEAFKLAGHQLDLEGLPGRKNLRLFAADGGAKSSVVEPRRRLQTKKLSRGHWRVLAEFVETNGKPLHHSYGYEIKLYLSDAPKDAERVTYRLHESYEQRTRHVRPPEPDFQEYITSYGDFELDVTVLRENGEKEKRTRWLSSALEEHYRNKLGPHVKRAIDDIIEN